VPGSERRRTRSLSEVKKAWYTSVDEHANAVDKYMRGGLVEGWERRENQRHRLNRSGDRQANSALWHIVITRMVYDPRTTEYIDRRRKEGLTEKEAVRCLKRYVAREVYGLLPHEKLGLDLP
jgi:hypothetical protein